MLYRTLYTIIPCLGRKMLISSDKACGPHPYGTDAFYFDNNIGELKDHGMFLMSEGFRSPQAYVKGV